MQRLHVDDLSGSLIEQGWPCLAIPAIAHEPAEYRLSEEEVYRRPAGELLQPDRDSREALEELKQELGSRIFAAQYQQNPTCPCQKLTLGYIGGVVRRELASPTCNRRSAQSAGLVHPCTATNACAFRCTTRLQNTHRTEKREVFYLWHPWAGCIVHIHEVVEKASGNVARCSRDSELVYRAMELPTWMLDRAACASMHTRPRGDVAALDALTTLRLRSPLSTVPAGIMSRRFRNVHHRRF